MWQTQGKQKQKREIIQPYNIFQRAIAMIFNRIIVHRVNKELHSWIPIHSCRWASGRMQAQEKRYGYHIFHRHYTACNLPEQSAHPITINVINFTCALTQASKVTPTPTPHSLSHYLSLYVYRLCTCVSDLCLFSLYLYLYLYISISISLSLSQYLYLYISYLYFSCSLLCLFLSVGTGAWRWRYLQFGCSLFESRSKATTMPTPRGIKFNESSLLLNCKAHFFVKVLVYSIVEQEPHSGWCVCVYTHSKYCLCTMREEAVQKRKKQNAKTKQGKMTTI